MTHQKAWAAMQEGSQNSEVWDGDRRGQNHGTGRGWHGFHLLGKDPPDRRRTFPPVLPFNLKAPAAAAAISSCSGHA